MKTHLILLLSLLSLFSFAEEKNNLAIVKKAGKWGALDVYGKLVIPCEYDRLEITCSELIAAKKNGKFGFIDRENKIRIDFTYDSCSGFYEQKAIVVKDQKCGYINEQNILLIDYKFDGADHFSNGLAAIREGYQWGFIDEKGEIVITPSYHLVIGEFNLNYCFVSKEGKVGLINRKGEIVLPFDYDLMTRFVEHDESLVIAYQYPCVYYLLSVKDNAYRYVTKKKFSYISEYRFDQWDDLECGNYPSSNYLEFKIEPYQSNCAPAEAERSKCSGHGIMNKEGEIIFCAPDEVKFLDPNHFLCYWETIGLTYKNIDHYQVTDSTGKPIDLDRYANVGDYDKGVLTVFSYLEEGKWGGINMKGETVIPFIYDDIWSLHDSIMVVEMSGRFYVTNIKGDYISSPLPYNIYKVKVLDHIIVYKSREGERKYGVFDHKGNVLLEPQFDEPIEF